MTHNQPRGTWQKEAAAALVSGAMFGSTVVLVGHPFDTIKTKMQAETAYLGRVGFVQSLTKVFKTTGIRGLYRGWLPPLWGSSIYRSMQFGVFEALYTKFGEYDAMKKTIPGSAGMQYRVVASGFLASTSRAVIESPIEYAKVKRQTGQSWKLAEAYQGFSMQWARTGGLMTWYFIVVDHMRRHTNAFDTKFGSFACSGFAATTGFWLVWPFEILKNQIQAGTEGVGSTVAERLRYLVKTNGYAGLFRGIVPGTASVFLRNGSGFLVMQAAQKKLTDWGLR